MQIYRTVQQTDILQSHWMLFSSLKSSFSWNLFQEKEDFKLKLDEMTIEMYVQYTWKTIYTLFASPLKVSELYCV